MANWPELVEHGQVAPTPLRPPASSPAASFSGPGKPPLTASWRGRRRRPSFARANIDEDRPIRTDRHVWLLRSPYTATVTVSPGSSNREEYRCPICHAVLRHREGRYDRRDIALVPAAAF